MSERARPGPGDDRATLNAYLPICTRQVVVSHGDYGRIVGTCPGSLIVHRDGTTAGCTSDDDQDGCRGRELRHEGDPTSCIDRLGGCNYCGVH
jgi:hypothetical protein